MSSAKDTATAKTPLINGEAKSPAQVPWYKAYWQLTRLHKFPSGCMVVFWPSAFGFMFGSKEPLPPADLAIWIACLFIGSTILHAAACVINDMWDRDFDRQVERCKNRPLAAGTASMFGASVLLILMTAVFFFMLSFLNQTAFICGVIGVLAFDAIYPAMKRVTNWPQAWLGIAINWGVPTGWLAASPDEVKNDAMWVLLFGTFCWAIFYDTIYACQDRKDDVKAGVKSTAILFGDYVKPILAVFGAGFIGTLIYVGLRTQQGPFFYFISVCGASAHLIWQLVTWNTEDGRDCWDKFNSNGHLGYIVLAGLLVEWYLK